MASQEEINFLQQRGKTLYRSAKYTEALDAFAKAITKCSVPKASLLDNRAATYEKLGELKNALRDAETTIRYHRKDVTGYLRTGRILQKMDQHEQAIKIYKYGLDKVAVSNPKDCKILHDKLSRQLLPPKSQDPFAVFPTEVAEMILQHFRFEETVRYLTVSKAWNRLLVSQPWLWHHLDLSKAKRIVPMSFVSHTIQRSKGKLNHATLHQLGNRDEKAMGLIVRNCRNLDTLEILTSHSMGGSSASLMSLSSLGSIKSLTIGKGAEITLDTVSVILNTCLSLSRAGFGNVISRGWAADWNHDMPNLKRLKLVGGNNQSSVGNALSLSKLFERTPNLEELTLNNWSGPHFAGVTFKVLTKLESLDLLDYYLRFSLDTFPESITKLRVNTAFSANLFWSTSSRMSSLPHLAELECSTSVNCLRLLQSIAGSGAERSLEKLVMNDSGLGSHDLSTVLDNPRLDHQLRELSLSRSDFNDDTAEFVIERFPLLRRLDISHTKITGVGVKTLVQGLSRSLQYLAVNQCTDLSLDAVDWAAKQRVAVDFRSQEKLVSGKKLPLVF